MKLKDCKHGVLVIDSRDGCVGMIIGITNNIPTSDYNERSKQSSAVPLVQWSHGATCGIHPGNIEVLK